MVRVGLVLGLILIGVAAILVLADSDGLSGRMRTQLPPRALAAVPLVLGVTLVVADLLN